MAGAGRIVVRRFALLLWLLTGGLHAATLERLSLDEMVEKSTAIVRGRITTAYSEAHRGIIYTHYGVQVIERWKGQPQAAEDVMVPGGAVQGLRQTFSGSPRLTEGREYVLFLWKAKSGGTHLIGLTQGLFSLPKDARGETLAVRSESTESMLDPVTGRPVRAERIQMPLSELSSRIRGVLGRGARP